MSGAQSYIIRLLRKVETWLGEHGHSPEASKVGKIVQKLAQADEIHTALCTLYHVDQFDQFALRLMWYLDKAERGDLALDGSVMDHQAEALSLMLLESLRNGQAETSPSTPKTLPDQVDSLYDSLHKFGRAVEELKRNSLEGGTFAGIPENQVYEILSELASLKESASAASKEDVVQFASACSGFIHHVLDSGLLQDVRIVNLLDNANLTLQTVFEAAGIEDNDSLQSTIELLKRPEDLLNGWGR